MSQPSSLILSMSFRPIRAYMDIDDKAATKIRSLTHSFIDQSPSLVKVLDRNLEDEFVVHRQQHLCERFFAERFAHIDHCLLYDICGASLNWGIESHTLTQRP
jgi:hypothetical protein